RRYFVYAYPRLDGRVQALIGSHIGPARRDISLVLGSMADGLAATWPDTGSTYRNTTSGVVLPLPRGWRQCSFPPRCGNPYTGMGEEEARHLLSTRAVFAPIDYARKIPGYESRPRVELHEIRDSKQSLGSLMDSLGEAGADAKEFVFDDGGVGRISESEHFI